jgi:hypothetical protein
LRLRALRRPEHTDQDPATGDHQQTEHAMDTTTSPPGSITCAKPGCGNTTTLVESVYVEGCGQVCPDCAGPLPAWWDDIEPPF